MTELPFRLHEEAYNFNVSDKAVWVYRLMGIVFINLFGFLDRVLTNVAVSKWGIQIEENPIMNFFNINPYIGLVAGVTVSVILLICIIYPKNNKVSFFGDCALILLLITEFLVIFNNILQFAGGIA